MKYLHELGEFGLVERLSRMLPASRNVLLGIGDDCAVLKCGDTVLLASVDLFIEDVHFRRKDCTARQIGWKACAASLSDIAAMGGKPNFALVSLACPANTEITLIEDIFLGLDDAVAQHGAVIVGGDTTRSSGKLILDVVVLGAPVSDRYLLRRGAQPDDHLIITGDIGMSAAGLDALQNERPASELVRAHLVPHPRIAEGQWLAARDEVHAMLDISDGLMQDAGHMARASDLGVDIRSAALAPHHALTEYALAIGKPPLDFMLHGGEDYELVFAVEGSQVDELFNAFDHEFRTSIRDIGVFTEQWTGVRVDGQAVSAQGFDHFSSTST